jgi:hypothetical protein
MVSWILNYINSPSFAFLINGSATSFFRGERGLRQGCPLSPLLFLLVVEGLNRLIKDVVVGGRLKGIAVSPTFYISHLLSVDDILIFCEGVISYVEHLNELLKILCKATRMLINKYKSSLYTSEINE